MSALSGSGVAVYDIQALLKAQSLPRSQAVDVLHLSEGPQLDRRVGSRVGGKVINLEGTRLQIIGGLSEDEADDFLDIGIRKPVVYPEPTRQILLPQRQSARPLKDCLL